MDELEVIVSNALERYSLLQFLREGVAPAQAIADIKLDLERS